MFHFVAVLFFWFEPWRVKFHWQSNCTAYDQPQYFRPNQTDYLPSTVPLCWKVSSGWSPSVQPFTMVVLHQGSLLSGGFSIVWSLLSVVFPQCSFSSGWSLIGVVFHQVVFHQWGLSLVWSLISAVFHQGGFSSVGYFIRGTFLSVVFHQCSLSSMQPFIRVVSHQCSLS